MNKPSEFFDGMKSQAAARKLINEIEVVKGMGEHYQYMFQSGVAFVGAFVVAFYRGWLLGLALLPGVPVIVCAGLLLAISVNARSIETIKSYVQSGGLAEQAIDAIRLVHAYGNESQEKKNYVQLLRQN